MRDLNFYAPDDAPHIPGVPADQAPGGRANARHRLGSGLRPPSRASRTLGFIGILAGVVLFVATMLVALRVQRMPSDTAFYVAGGALIVFGLLVGSGGRER